VINILTHETVDIALGLFRSSWFISGLTYENINLQLGEKAYVYASYARCL